MPGRLRCRLEPNTRRREAALVYIYPRPAAGLTGDLQGVQERPDLARACPQDEAPDSLWRCPSQVHAETSTPSSKKVRISSRVPVVQAALLTWSLLLEECNHRAKGMVD